MNNAAYVYVTFRGGFAIIETPEHGVRRPSGNALINTGAVIAVLLAFPSLFVGLFGAVGVITGQKLVAGALGAVWGWMAVVGAYELNRRKFNWVRGSLHGDRNLMAGSLAAAVGLAVGGAVHETMPALVIVPALSAIKQASDGHATKLLSLVHALVLVAGLGVAAWFYQDKVIGSVLLDRIAALP